MRNIVPIALIFFCSLRGYGQTVQTYNIDSLRQLLYTNLHDTSRIWVLNNLARNIENPDTVLTLCDQAITLSKKHGFKKGEAEAYNNIGYHFNVKGNYPKSLEYYIRSIQLSESIGFEAGLKRSYNSISTVYMQLKDFSSAINYARRARNISKKLRDPSTLTFASSWLAKAFLETNQMDSALKYAQESYEVANRINEPLPMYFATERLGEIHAATGRDALALEYLRLALVYSNQDGRPFRIAGVHQKLANLFEVVGPRDSCSRHALKAFEVSSQEGLAATLLSASLLLSRISEGVNDKESLRYIKIALAAQDSLFNQEKNRRVEALNFNEMLRQRELAASKQYEADTRRINLQYAGIGVGLVVFGLVSLLFSRSIIANEKLISFLSILALLMIFEFLNLLLHPFLGQLTHHSPILMLVIMVGVAAVLIPFHHRLERSITRRLVDKNKQIRLEAAKKIIEQIQNNTGR